MSSSARCWQQLLVRRSNCECWDRRRWMCKMRFWTMGLLDKSEPYSMSPFTIHSPLKNRCHANHEIFWHGSWELLLLKFGSICGHPRISHSLRIRSWLMILAPSPHQTKTAPSKQYSWTQLLCRHRLPRMRFSRRMMPRCRTCNGSFIFLSEERWLFFEWGQRMGGMIKPVWKWEIKSQYIWHSWYMGMDQYLLIPFLEGWTSIYQLFLCSPGVQGFDPLPYVDGEHDHTQSNYWAT